MSKYGRMDYGRFPSIAERYPVDGCTLGKERAVMCTGSVCSSCGWNQDEIARRRNLIRKRGLMPNPETGLRRLIVTRRGI